MRFDQSDILTCRDCGKETLRRSVVQIYCTSCSSKREAARGRRPNARVKELTAKQSAAGLASLAQSFEMPDVLKDDDELGINRRIYVRVPYSRHLSNAAGRHGHCYLRGKFGWTS